VYTREDFEKIGIDTSKIRNGKGICPKCGMDRKNKRDPSLYVNFNDGVYKCFNHPCDFKGSVSYKKKEFVKKEYQKPIPRLQKVSDDIIKWFEGRKISNYTLLRLNITQSVENFNGVKKKTICFNYYKNEKLVNIKFRSKDKNFKLIGGAELCLYNIDAAKDVKELLICEGEIDCATCLECKIYNAVSVPNGASGNSAKLEYIDNCWQEIEHIEKFIIAVDDDTAGNALKEALSFRLGVDKCWFITYPNNLVVPDQNAPNGLRKCKDLNEVHVWLGEESVINTIKSAKQLPIVGAYQVMDVADEMIDIFQKGLTQGSTTQYGEIDQMFKWKKKEQNLFSGYGNAGKTSFVLHLMLVKSMYDGWKWGIFSPENFPATDFFIDLVEMYVGKHVDDRRGMKMTESEYVEAMEFLQDHFIYVYPPDIQDISTIHDIFRRLHLQHGLDGVLIDPFNQLDNLFEGNSRDDQILSVILKETKRFALMNNLSYNIIAHPKNVMPDKEGKRPDVEVWHLAGGAMWNNKMDNIVMLDRPEWYKDKTSTYTTVKTHKIKRRRTGGKAGGLVEFDYLYNQSRYCVRGTDKMILDIKRSEEYKADKDFYLNELRRTETMGILGTPTVNTFLYEDKTQGNFFDEAELDNLDDFEGF